MKSKLFFVFVLLFVSITTMGQVDSLLTDKKGNLILPQRGDYAIGISTNPIFDYLGNMFSLDGSNSLRLSLLDGATLYGKYFTSAETAIRAKVLFNANFSDRLVPMTGERDFYTISESYYNINITLGYEKRKGTGRLQFSYGPELSVGTYLNKTNVTGVNYPPDSERITPLKVGARVFGGAEYFFMPKMSVGAEVGFGINGDIWSKSKMQQGWDYEERKVKNWSIGTDILGGQIVLLFHI